MKNGDRADGNNAVNFFLYNKSLGKKKKNEENILEF